MWRDSLDDAPKGYKDFDKGAAKNCIDRTGCSKRPDKWTCFSFASACQQVAGKPTDS